jgi:hypothetical protein
MATLGTFGLTVKHQNYRITEDSSTTTPLRLFAKANSLSPNRGIKYKYKYTEVRKQHGGHKDNTTILTNNKHNISRSTCLAHGWQHHIGKNWHNRAPASGEYTITPEDGRVGTKHVDE